MKTKENKVVLKRNYGRIYERCLVKAQKLIPNKRIISQKIKKARTIFERLQNLSRFQNLSKHICNFCDLLSDYFDGVYTKLPLATIIALVGGLLYVVLPIDALADFIPFIGFLDDAAVLAFIVDTERNDVNEYLKWKESASLKDKNNDSVLYDI